MPVKVHGIITEWCWQCPKCKTINSLDYNPAEEYVWELVCDECGESFHDFEVEK